MNSKIISIIKYEGLGGLAEKIIRHTMPRKLKYFDNLKNIFESGVGLEIGGASQVFGKRGPIPVYSVAKLIDNCNFDSETVWEGAIVEGETFIFNKDKAPGRQYVVEASDLQCIHDSEYDYVLSSHCIEHLANPIKGLYEWMRVLKVNGFLVLVVPHKDGTFDHRRPTTTLEHMIEDFRRQTKEDDQTHLSEILQLHDISRDPEAGTIQFFHERAKKNVENRCLHQHVFDTKTVVELVNYVGLQILTIEHFKPYHIVIVAKKIDVIAIANNARFIEKDSLPFLASPFPSDKIKLL